MTYDIVTTDNVGRAPRTGTRGIADHSRRQVIARRAAIELREGAVLNFGFGIPDAVSKLSRSGRTGSLLSNIEHGTYGGTMLTVP